MAPADPAVRWGSRVRHGLRTYRALVSGFVLTVGVLLTVLAVGAFTPLQSVPPFPSINAATAQPSANYNLVFIVVGPIVSIVGGYLVGSYAIARRRFEHLMLTKSKAEFLRNIPELEDLLWDLTPNDELRYEAKRSELKVRR
jgi:uncharacterized protein DUF3198